MNNKTAISSLNLKYFRNHTSLSLEVGAAAVVVVAGANGIGKTNLLEAISFLTPGRGLRNARFADVQQLNNANISKGWSVSALVSANDEETRVGTGILSESDNKRIVRINGETQRSQNELAKIFSAVWLTPAMGQMFSQGQGVRRKFFDRLTYSFDATHATHVSAYEHYVRERQKILLLPRPDKNWLDVLEAKIASYAVIISAARLSALENLNHALTQTSSVFPVAKLVLQGDAETALQNNMLAIDVENSIMEKLAQSRQTDGYSKRCSVGTHRSQWQVWFDDKSIEAENCSTGEQKALLLSIILAHARARTNWCGLAPILLLDEVVAHLDAKRRQALFAEIAAIGAQSWMTGTDKADFSQLQDAAFHVTI